LIFSLWEIVSKQKKNDSLLTDPSFLKKLSSFYFKKKKN